MSEPDNEPQPPAEPPPDEQPPLQFRKLIGHYPQQWAPVDDSVD